MVRAESRFAGEAEQVGAARHLVAGVLGSDWPCVDDAVLLTSELAANAVMHSRSGRPGGKFTVRAAVKPGDYRWVEVQDEGGVWDSHTGSVEGGRGLEIVNTLASDWGRDGSPAAGWTVWARIDWPRTAGVSR